MTTLLRLPNGGSKFQNPAPESSSNGMLLEQVVWRKQGSCVKMSIYDGLFQAALSENTAPQQAMAHKNLATAAESS